MKLKVLTPNRMILIKNTPIRTPCEIDIKSKNELEFYKSYLKTECAEYEIINTPNKSIPEPKPIITKSIKKVETKYEEEIDESSLKLIDEDVSIEEPKIEELGDLKESDKILDAVLR